MTYFYVKEKVCMPQFPPHTLFKICQMKDKNKLVPRLLGISSDSIVRADETTKEIIKEWPMQQVRRWAASAHTFTLVCCCLIYNT
jgi:hypothetical protein